MLEVIHGPDRGHLLPLPSGEPQLLGRSSEALPLSDRRISRRHAELMPSGDDWLLRDLQSSNGTWVNGVRVTGVTALRIDDVIGCGDTQARLIQRDDLPAGPSQPLAVRLRMAPPPVMPPHEADASRMLGMIWSLTNLIDAQGDIATSQLEQAIATGLDAEAAGEQQGEDLLAVQVYLDREPIVLRFTTRQGSWQSWQRSAADLAAWLIESLIEAHRVQERDRLAAMGRTVAAISHAVKNILQGLQGGAGALEMALDRGDLDLAREAWPILQRNLDRIHDLTFNMLAWSRTSHLDLEPGSLEDLVGDIAQTNRAMFEQRRVTLEIAAASLPDVPFDSAALHQAVLNLLLNALEAAPPRRGVVRMATMVDDAAQEALIAISDNGEGIEPAQHATIFEPFASTRGQRGTGLGLAVTRRIVAAHGGRVTVDSSPGQGACFTIHLPLTAPAGDPGDTDIPPPTMPVEPTRFERGQGE